jgi:hypothetical protein
MTRDSAGSSHRGPSRVEVRCESLRNVEKGPFFARWVTIFLDGDFAAGRDEEAARFSPAVCCALAHPRGLSRLALGSERVEGADDALAGR